MGGPVTMLFSRNMVVLRHDHELTLVNTMRLDEAGLAALDELGKVKHVIRLAGFHGRDDPFYKDRYDATVWAVDGHVWARGFDNTKIKAEDGYFQADRYMTDSTELPIPGARLITIDCKAGEGLLVLDRDGGIAISGDALQNWSATDEYFNVPAKIVMKLMGFIKPHNVGPGWLKQAQPDLSQVKSLLDVPFDTVLPAHGGPVVGGAKDKFRPAIERATAKL